MKKGSLLIVLASGLSVLSACGGGGTGGGNNGGGGGGGGKQAATHFSVNAVATATAGTAFNITVTALDISNNTVTTYTGTVHFTSTDKQAILPHDSTLTNGTQSFSVTLESIESSTITATDTVSASITGTSNPVTVNALATQLSVKVPANATIGRAFDVTVTALDASNNTVASYSGTVHFTSKDAKASLPQDSGLTNGSQTFPVAFNSVGSWSITATDTVTHSLTGTSSLVNVTAAAAANPVPLINQPLSPDAVMPGGTSFTLTVNGTGFVSGSLVEWNGSARATNLVSGSRLTATILASDIATFNTAFVSVVNPAPGGGKSNVVFFETTRPTSSVALGIGSTFAMGAGPLLVATGDFNGDGNLDLVVADEQNGAVSVLLGKGDGTFQPAMTFAVGTFPFAAATGDFNGDGKLDLAVANSVTNNVSILLGNGDGTFQPAVNYGAGEDPTSIVAADFNGDGKLDLAVVSQGTSQVGVLLGNGDGTFQAPLEFAAEQQPQTLAVGDFNGDGKLDLAVTNLGSNNLSVLLGNGDGTFQAAADFGVGTEPTSIVAADLNGDGKLDLVVANLGSQNVSVLLGNGDGTFQPAAGYSVGSTPNALAVGDFNGDGKLDLLVGNASNNVSLFLGNGDGTLQAAANYASGSEGLGNGATLAVGDFNRDGRFDLAIAALNSSAVSILLQPSLISGSDAILSATSLTFSTELLGTTSAAQSVTVTNYGAVPLNIMSITVSANFGESDDCGSSLAAGASCTISVTFAPSQQGNLNGTVSIADDAADSPQKVTLSGIGTSVKLFPTSLNFGRVTIGTTSPAKTVELTNVGATTLTITGITITGSDAGDFAQTQTCGSSLAAGASCSISVTFKPSAGEVRTATLSISDDAGGSPQTVTLSGGCIPPGGACFGPSHNCCPAPFPHQSFCSNPTGWGTCVQN